MADVPLLDGVLALADAGVVTGASARNWNSYGAEVRFGAQLSNAQQALLCDPQTSGGLLVACAPDALALVVDVFRRNGFAYAACVGTMIEGEPIALVE